MDHRNDDLGSRIRATMDRVHALRDEARVKIHLASMDARDAFERLTPKLEEAERMAESASRATLETIEKTAKKLEDLVASL